MVAGITRLVLVQVTRMPQNPDLAGTPRTRSAGRILFGIGPEEFLLLLDFAQSRRSSNLNRTSARTGSQTVHSANLSSSPGTDTSETRPARDHSAAFPMGCRFLFHAFVHPPIECARGTRRRWKSQTQV